MTPYISLTMADIGKKLVPIFDILIFFTSWNRKIEKVLKEQPIGFFLHIPFEQLIIFSICLIILVSRRQINWVIVV